MDKYSALADPTRRKIIELLAQHGELPATQISDQFPISAPAISQHLKVLRQARLVQVEKQAQQRIYRIDPEALLELEQWASRVRRLWNQRFDALEKILEEETRKGEQ
jgi:DNA-binding transcriptional ArsR family regulator